VRDLSPVEPPITRALAAKRYGALRLRTTPKFSDAIRFESWDELLEALWGFGGDRLSTTAIHELLAAAYLPQYAPYVRLLPRGFRPVVYMTRMLESQAVGDQLKQTITAQIVGSSVSQYGRWPRPAAWELPTAESLVETLLQSRPSQGFPARDSLAS
jgi:hypothetical protein